MFDPVEGLLERAQNGIWYPNRAVVDSDLFWQAADSLVGCLAERRLTVVQAAVILEAVKRNLLHSAKVERLLGQ